MLKNSYTNSPKAKAKSPGKIDLSKYKDDESEHTSTPKSAPRRFITLEEYAQSSGSFSATNDSAHVPPPPINMTGVSLSYEDEVLHPNTPNPTS